MMNNGWDNGFDGGMSVFGGILMMTFWVALIVGIVLLVVWLTRQVAGGQVFSGGQTTGQVTGQTDTALDILNQRYARGEIDKAEYEEKKKDLTG
ncbi:MAG: SHOCT domain-containing protein [Actinobacteria bacterium]|nr:SHOCT domain-containing protein [Actinomycetota bacterium]